LVIVVVGALFVLEKM